MKDYTCKIASVDEVKFKWSCEIKRHKKSNWKIWMNESINQVNNGQCIVYYGILNGKIISEATAMLDRNIVQNSENLLDNETVYLCAFRTSEKYQSKGYFSKLFSFMIEDLKNRGYKKVTLGVEPNEIKNLEIYRLMDLRILLNLQRKFTLTERLLMLTIML